MFLAASFLAFVLFTVNVAMGASGGNAVLGAVGEMLVLFASAVFFVVAILKREADRDKEKGS